MISSLALSQLSCRQMTPKLKLLDSRSTMKACNSENLALTDWMLELKAQKLDELVDLINEIKMLQS